jgi:phosphoglycerol transferase
VPFFIAAFVLDVWSLKALKLPFDYYGDAVFYLMSVKTVMTTGWYLSDPTLAAPGVHFFGDFATPEGFNYLLIKILSWFISDWALLANLFFLMGFSLIALTSLFVLRQFGLSYPFALTASLLYSFLPYHLIKSESHLFLSAYYFVPLIIWLATRIYQNRLPRARYSILIAVLVGSSGIYYAYFGSFFLLLAGLICASQTRQWAPLRSALSLIAIIIISIGVNVWPLFPYQWKHGSNLTVMERSPFESEKFGLKISQMVLPRNSDRLFSEFMENYKKHTVSGPENDTSALGLVASLGFIYLISSLFFKRKEDLLYREGVVFENTARSEGQKCGVKPTHSKPDSSVTSGIITSLAHFNLGAILLATFGGFSSLVSLFLLAGIRSYNRISIFIAFFSLSAIFLALQDKKHRWGISIALLLLGLFTQTSSLDAPAQRYPKIRAEYKNDRRFFRKIEKTLGDGGMVFQLPYIHFPEGQKDLINSYAHFKGPLHSRSLKWSFGAMRGREPDLWQRQTAQLDVSDMIHELKDKGFTGLYLDKFGYLDAADQMMRELSKVLKRPPLFDMHGRSFWDLREVK